MGRAAGAATPATDFVFCCFISLINGDLGFNWLNWAMELPLQQSSAFGTALTLMGRHVKRVPMPGAAPVLAIRRFGVSFAPRGPVWDTPCPQTLRRAALRLINAESPSPVYRQAGYRQIMTGAYVAEIDLRGAAQDRLARAKGKWRNAWRKSQGTKLQVKQTRFDPALHDWLLREDEAQQRAKRFRTLPHDLIRAYAVAAPGDVVVFTAVMKHDVVAAMLFLRHGPVATYHLGWAGPGGRKTNAHYALLVAACDHFAAARATRLDLGTVDTDNAPGLARFKIGSGARIRPLGGTWLRMPGL